MVDEELGDFSSCMALIPGFLVILRFLSHFYFLAISGWIMLLMDYLAQIKRQNTPD